METSLIALCIEYHVPKSTVGRTQPRVGGVGMIVGMYWSIQQGQDHLQYGYIDLWILQCHAQVLSACLYQLLVGVSYALDEQVYVA